MRSSDKGDRVCKSNDLRGCSKVLRTPESLPILEAFTDDVSQGIWQG